MEKTLPGQLAGRCVLITGASSGFGAATARLLGAQNARLWLGARRVRRLEEVALQARQAGASEVLFHPLDVARTDSVEAFVAWVRTRASQIDILINNAGGAQGLDPVSAGHDSDWEAMVQANFLGLVRMTRAVLPLMGKRAGAAIINIGSIAGRVAYEGGSVYCGCKAAELQVTRALRLELSGSGIRVCTIDPGLAETEFSQVRFKGDEVRAKQVYAGMQPLTAEDVAEAILWVANRPTHVCIDEMLIKPTDQAAIHKVYRRSVVGA